MVTYNVRGGAEIRKRVKAIEQSKNKAHTCPRTGKVLKRISNSVWATKGKNQIVYAGGTYSPSTPAGEIVTRMLRDYNKKIGEKPVE